MLWMKIEWKEHLHIATISAPMTWVLYVWDNFSTNSKQQISKKYMKSNEKRIDDRKAVSRFFYFFLFHHFAVCISLLGFRLFVAGTFLLLVVMVVVALPPAQYLSFFSNIFPLTGWWDSMLYKLFSFHKYYCMHLECLIFVLFKCIEFNR